MPKNSDDVVIPEQWIYEQFGAQEDQAALDIYQEQHNLKVLAQRKAFKERFGVDYEEYPADQTLENIGGGKRLL